MSDRTASAQERAECERHEHERVFCECDARGLEREAEKRGRAQAFEEAAKMAKARLPEVCERDECEHKDGDIVGWNICLAAALLELAKA